MPTIFDNRFLGMPEEAAKKFAEMVNAEDDFVNCLGGNLPVVDNPPSRHNLVAIDEVKNDVAEQLEKLEAKKSEFLIELQKFEETTRDNREPFPGIGSRSTSAPTLITRAGILELSSDNVDAALRIALSDPANRITYFQKLAFRAGRERLDTVIYEMASRVKAKEKTAENYRNDHAYKRADKAEDAASELRIALSKIREIKIRLEAAGIEDVHARLLSGRSINYRARFPMTENAKWSTTKFSIAHVAIVAAKNLEITKAPSRDRSAKYKCVGLFANVGIFLPVQDAEALGF